MSNDPRWRIAFHEAGHVAAALRVGCCPTHAGVDGDGGGFTHTAEPHHPADGLFVASAGRAAEEMVCGPSPYASQTHDADRVMATQYAKHYAPMSPGADLRAMASARVAATRFVHANAGIIAAIADAIIQRGVIDGATIAAIAKQHPVLSPNPPGMVPYARRGPTHPPHVNPLAATCPQDVNGNPLLM